MSSSPRPSMNCPTCGAWSVVLETRRRLNGVVARRYECAGAHGHKPHRWTTLQQPGRTEFVKPVVRRKS